MAPRKGWCKTMLVYTATLTRLQKRYCSFDVQHTCTVHHLFDEKTKDIYTYINIYKVKNFDFRKTVLNT